MRVLVQYCAAAGVVVLSVVVMGVDIVVVGVDVVVVGTVDVGVVAMFTVAPVLCV